jgi:Co/Zn/Cd efflux system component
MALSATVVLPAFELHDDDLSLPTRPDDLPKDAHGAEPSGIHDGVALGPEIRDIAEFHRVPLTGAESLQTHDVAFPNPVLLASGNDHGFHRAASWEENDACAGCPNSRLDHGGVGLSTRCGLLWRHRADDLNMRSVWLCSRNDVMANVGVLVAAIGVGLTDSAWPDIVVGLAVAGLFVTSAAGVIRATRRPAALSHSRG